MPYNWLPRFEGRRLLALVLTTLLLAVCPLVAQRLDPAKWSLEIEPTTAAPGSVVTGRLVHRL